MITMDAERLPYSLDELCRVFPAEQSTDNTDGLMMHATHAPTDAERTGTAPAPPLCVDLDGTLIRTDSLLEALLQLARKHPLDLFRLPVWAVEGKASFKRNVAQRVSVNAALLPYREEVIDFLKQEKAAGRRIVLATASHRSTAEAVADHLKLFDEIVGSDDINFKGPAKLAELQRRYGEHNFDYIGDAAADLPIWKNCRQAYVVSRGATMERLANGVCKPARVFYDSKPLKPAIKALRPHQWVKNLLLFIPVVLAHRVGQMSILAAASVAFVAFSLCASAIYIINDLLDLESDRRHPTKRLRPFAAGTISPITGIAIAAGLLIASFSCSLLLPWRFQALLGVYVLLTTLYSFWLKRKMLVDVILLSALYTHRIISGAYAVEVELTMWLLAFSMFFFLSLAFAKRYSELIQVEDSGEEHIAGRGYQVRDLRIIESIGPSSGYLAVLVFCNYLDSPIVRGYPGHPALYAHPQVLWLAAPILLYWVTRIWFIARRRALHDDPIVFAIHDRRSYVCGIMVATIILLASGRWHIG